MAIYCPNCGIALPDGVSFCDACGTPVKGMSQGQGAGAGGGASLGSVTCPVCAASALPGEAFCDNCGTSLLAPAPTEFIPTPSPTFPPSSAHDSVHSPQSSVLSSRTPHLVVLQPPPPATLSLPGHPEMIVGRADPQSNSYPDVDLGPYGGLDLGVSRRHFRLTRTGEQYYIEDLGAMNGTTVNGQKLPPYSLQPLRAGDRISLGKMEMRFDLA